MGSVGHITAHQQLDTERWNSLLKVRMKEALVQRQHSENGGCRHSEDGTRPREEYMGPGTRGWKEAGVALLILTPRDPLGDLVLPDPATLSPAGLVVLVPKGRVLLSEDITVMAAARAP